MDFGGINMIFKTIIKNSDLEMNLDKLSFDKISVLDKPIQILNLSSTNNKIGAATLKKEHDFFTCEMSFEGNIEKNILKIMEKTKSKSIEDVSSISIRGIVKKWHEGEKGEEVIDNFEIDGLNFELKPHNSSGVNNK